MRIESVEIPVADPREYAAFLHDVLDLPAAGAVVTAGASTIVLRAADPVVQHLAFTVRTGSFVDAVARLSARVLLLDRDGRTEFAGPPSWDSRSVYFDGPDGHVLELIERGRLRQDGPDIACVSEVGVAVPDVPAAVADLVAAGLAVFGAASPDFAAIGDDDGLLIIATTGRPWLPTIDRLAAPADMTVRLGNGAAVPVGAATVAGVRPRAAG